MKWVMTVVLLLAAAASVFSAILVFLGNIMTPGAARLDRMVLIAVIAIVPITIGALLLAFKFHRAAAGRWLAAAAVLVVAIGLVPQIADWQWKAERAAAQKEEHLRYHARFLVNLEIRKQDVDTRIAARRPYTGAEAEAFVEFVRHSNLRTISNGPDHTAVAMALLQSALEAKILDPNVPVRNRFIGNAPPVPMFLQYHKLIRQRPQDSVETRDWNILLLLVANGADMRVPETGALAADLRKKATPLYGGIYLDLK